MPPRSATLEVKANTETYNDFVRQFAANKPNESLAFENALAYSNEANQTKTDHTKLQKPQTMQTTTSCTMTQSQATERKP